MSSSVGFATSRFLQGKVVAACLVASLLLGLSGYYRHLEPDGLLAWLEVVYKSLLLFLLSADADGQDYLTWPWQIHVARFSAPACLAWPTVQAVRAFLQRDLRSRRLRRLQGHVVVLGWSSATAGQAASLLGPSRERLAREVVWVPGHELPRVIETEQMFIVPGDPRDPATLQAARVASAKVIYVAMGSDREGLEVARGIRDQVRVGAEASGGRAGRPRATSASFAAAETRCYLEMKQGTRSPLEQDGVICGLESAGQLAVYPLQTHRIAARALVREHPPHEFRRPRAGERPLHVLVVGLEAFGSALVKQLVRSCHYLDHQNVRITIVAEDAQREFRRLQRQAPGLHLVADVRLFAEDPNAVSHEQWDAWQAGGVFDRGYITTLDPADADALAMDAKDGLGSHGTDNQRWAVLCTACAATAADDVDGSPTFDPAAVDLIGAHLRESDPDAAARAIHEAYQRGTSEIVTGVQQKRAESLLLAEWRALSERVRDQNRDAADFQELLLELAELSDEQRMQLREAMSTPGGAAPVVPRPLADCEECFDALQRAAAVDNHDGRPVTFDDLAEVEHRRWMASKVLLGYTHGEVERPDDVRRLHGDLVPYVQLDVATRNKDKVNVRDALLRQMS